MHSRVAVYGVFIFSNDCDDDLFFGGVALNTYIFSVVGIVLISSFITAVSAEGKTAGMVKGMTKLVCLLVILSPIFQLLIKNQKGNNENFYQDIFGYSVIEMDNHFIEYYSETTVSYLEDRLEKEVYEKYDFSVNISIDWAYEEDNSTDIYDLAKIKINQIIISEKQALSEEDKSILWEYLTKNYCSEVLIE